MNNVGRERERERKHVGDARNLMCVVAKPV